MKSPWKLDREGKIFGVAVLLIVLEDLLQLHGMITFVTGSSHRGISYFLENFLPDPMVFIALSMIGVAAIYYLKYRDQD